MTLLVSDSVDDLTARIEGLGMVPAKKSAARLSAIVPKPSAIWLRHELPVQTKKLFVSMGFRADEARRERSYLFAEHFQSSIRAPCACAMCLTIASPNPVPPESRDRALSTR